MHRSALLWFWHYKPRCLNASFFQKPARQLSSTVTIHVRRGMGEPQFIELAVIRVAFKLPLAACIRLLKTKQNPSDSIPLIKHENENFCLLSVVYCGNFTCETTIRSHSLNSSWCFCSRISILIFSIPSYNLGPITEIYPLRWGTIVAKPFWSWVRVLNTRRRKLFFPDSWF
jgi:hypothetical protein